MHVLRKAVFVIYASATCFTLRRCTLHAAPEISVNTMGAHLLMHLMECIFLCSLDSGCGVQVSRFPSCHRSNGKQRASGSCSVLKRCDTLTCRVTGVDTHRVLHYSWAPLCALGASCSATVWRSKRWDWLGIRKCASSLRVFVPKNYISGHYHCTS